MAIHQFAFPGRIELQANFCGSKTCFPLFETRRVCRRLGMDSKRVNLGFLSTTVSASSSASVSGSGAEYSEQLLGAKPKPKGKKIAGIDQDELLDPALLADPDSCFCHFKGVDIHHKICEAESPTHILWNQTASQVPSQTKKISPPIVLLHGFGASVFSWHRVMKPLAQVSGSKVLAFDRPAFGLTSRPNLSEDTKPLNPYSMAFSVLATLYFIDSLAAQKAVLVGHSAGSCVAVNTYFEAPQRIAALVLVAPAILAPAKSNIGGKQFQTDVQMQEESSNPNTNGNPFTRIFNILSNFSKYIVQAVMRLMKGMGEMLSSLYKKALSALLRSALAVALIRMVMDKFGIAAVRNAWYDSNQVTDHILNGYTKPLKAKGWDKALAEYIAEMLADFSSGSKPPLEKRLHEVSCPVLIIMGDCDRLVPSWNSERLSRAIPGSRLEVIKNCGHLPHEEKPEEFMSLVQKFLLGVFGGSEEQFLQAAATT